MSTEPTGTAPATSALVAGLTVDVAAPPGQAPATGGDDSTAAANAEVGDGEEKADLPEGVSAVNSEDEGADEEDNDEEDNDEEDDDEDGSAGDNDDDDWGSELSLPSDATGSTDRAFRQAKDKLQQLRDTVLAEQKLKTDYSDLPQVHIEYPTVQGVTTTVAGTGLPGWRDGPGEVAQFNCPGGVGLTPLTPRTIRYGVHNFVYIADTNNHCVRRIDRANVVTTFAGCPGKPGKRDGPAATALFNEPSSVCVNTDGDVFVTDRQNHCIRKIDVKSREVTTFAGSGRARYGET